VQPRVPLSFLERRVGVGARSEVALGARGVS
jgi:hypothetical protein